MTIEHLSFAYGERKILSDCTFSVSPGEIVALMGPSGCGKTTLLRILAGLEKGNGTVTDCENPAVSFQEPRLFPTLTVAENLLVVAENTQKMDEILHFLELKSCRENVPNELSGGMQSRVSIARSLLYPSESLLWDEPFSAWDEPLRARLIPCLREQIKKEGKTCLAVLHDEADAVLFADRILRWEGINASL